MIIAFYRKRGYYVMVMYLTIMHLTMGDGRMITDDEVFPQLFSLSDKCIISPKETLSIRECTLGGAE